MFLGLKGKKACMGSMLVAPYTAWDLLWRINSSMSSCLRERSPYVGAPKPRCPQQATEDTILLILRSLVF